MDIVYKNDNDIKIYISDINSITLESLSLNDIGLVISIGCCIDNIYNNDDNKTTTSITRLSYPDILDQPEQVIIHILNDTNNAISNAIKNNTNVLIHCIYGQSRSVTVTISYLMTIGIDLQESIDMIKRARPCICINPGFLCQLLLLSKLGHDSPHVKTIINATSSSSITNTIRNNDTSSGTSSSSSSSGGGGGKMFCKYCSNIIDSKEMILHPNLCTCLNNCQCLNYYHQFLTINVDDFWKGYKPINSNKVSKKGHKDGHMYLNDTNSIIIPVFDDNDINNNTNNDNKKRKLETDHIPFNCTNRRCCKELGVIQAGNLCNGFITVKRLIYLDRSKINISEDKRSSNDHDH